ncbi:DUF3231 family protein [Bacillus sp. EB106-08-02-XG196]|uniref:DUF3231 family protein n=1 Tax=Bacillus sp. EB106-08-02-XG196 TaxID=2737049 RepID=UPI0015C4B206|nr:DUF3231 family protein [Bacillus sp. EB106-08-02-XG196]NWQ42503.1 DUF3231 family protein [Bacillus sp. EB106-08-02-XG196]
MPEKPAITSSELGTLWLTYLEKTMILRMLEYFIEKADDKKAQDIMTNLYEEIDLYVGKITETLQNDGAVIPVGFTSQDVNKEVPKLYDNGFDIMFVRLLKEISMGLHSLNITMAYREDIVMIFKELTAITQKYYNLSTQYLLEKGMIARPPYVSMPKSVEFVKDTNYLGGLSINPFSEKRTLNTVEVAHIHHSIESNIIGMQMIIGFAQCANSGEVKNFFNEGAELAKNIINELSETLLESGIQTPEPSGGNVTRSTVAPFSDKMMMYCTSLFCSFAMGGSSLGTAFSLRNDLPAKMSTFMKDTFEYAHKGAKIMIKNGWMEEPPQMEERGQIIKKS